jgi:putative colanic acid biosynthesis acetyltransferase WcaF
LLDRSSRPERVDLSQFDNSRYQVGRSLPWQLLWFFLGLPLLRSALIPFSAFRCVLLRAFGAEIGDGVVIKPGVRVKYPWKLRVGNHCWIGEDAWIDNIAQVSIHSHVCISQGVYLCTGNHDWSDPAFALVERPIEIHEGAWVAAGAILGPGVVIGECAIAGLGSVVSGPIPPYEVHSGNPAVYVRRREISPQHRNDLPSMKAPSPGVRG